MKYIKDYKDGDRVFDIYFCKFKSSAVTKNGKNYDNVIIQDKTGTMDAKIWDPNNVGIADFEAMDYIEVYGDVTSFNGALQLNVKRVRRCEEGEYDEREYMPVSKKNIDEMYDELVKLIESVKNTYLNTLLQKFFVEDEAFAERFKKASAAKTVHHGFIGGLLEHTLGVAKLCDYYCTAYPVLNRDLLITAAICHDMGKTKEINAFPLNDYTDEGQFLGHIVMGSEMIGEKVRLTMRITLMQR
jgi:3'-5' exoribonuclease